MHPNGLIVFREKWHAPWWMWAGGLLLAVGCAAEIHLGHSGARAVVPYVTTVPMMAALLWWLGRIEIRVTETELWVDDAHIALRFIADAKPLSTAARDAALGRHFDPLAFVVRRPWLRGAVMVSLNDPDDATPYWIVSSRRPAELAAAIQERLPRIEGPAKAPESRRPRG